MFREKEQIFRIFVQWISVAISRLFGMFAPLTEQDTFFFVHTAAQSHFLVQASHRVAHWLHLPQLGENVNKHNYMHLRYSCLLVYIFLIRN